MSSEDRDGYKPKDAITEAGKGALVVGGGGLFAAALVNALAKQNVGPWAIFTRTGGLIGTFVAVGGVFEFSRHASANLRRKDDALNTALGGFLSGAILGLRSGSIARVIGYGSLVSVILGGLDFTGGTFRGWKKDPNEDEFERKERMRLNRRRPLSETIEELGEGRSIRPPGYEERRRERLREKYGIEVKPHVSADPNDF